MPADDPIRVAILSPRDRQTGRDSIGEGGRFADLFKAFASRMIHAEPAFYRDDLREEVRRQILKVDAVLVWVNPLEGGRDRSALDAMLREVAASGVFVSTHPDVILKLGTKEVLHRTRDLGWGGDTHLYVSIEQMRRELPLRLSSGRARVLKQIRGNGGNGVWKVQLPRRLAGSPGPGAVIRTQHALRGCCEEEMTLRDFYERCEPYFVSQGRMIDQEYQERLPEGMIRCYLVHDAVAGFGHQEVNALCPAPPGAPPAEAPVPGPRLYHPPSMPEFQDLKTRLEQEWVPAMQRLLKIDTQDLPVLWDCDFLLGPKTDDGKDTYVLCEINVSSVAPYPESAVPCIVDATVARTREARRRRGLAT